MSITGRSLRKRGNKHGSHACEPHEHGAYPPEKAAHDRDAAAISCSKDKRDELMKQFLDIVRENKALREQVEDAF